MNPTRTLLAPLALALAAPLVAQTYLDHVKSRLVAAGSIESITYDVDDDGVLDMIAYRLGKVTVHSGRSRRKFEATGSTSTGIGRRVAVGDFGQGLTGQDARIAIASNGMVRLYDAGLQVVQGIPTILFPPGVPTQVRGMVGIQVDNDPELELAMSFEDGIRVYDLTNQSWSVVVSGRPVTDGFGFQLFCRDAAGGPRLGCCALGAPLNVEEFDLAGNSYPIMPLPANTTTVNHAHMLDDDTLGVALEAATSFTQPGGEVYLHHFPTAQTSLAFGGQPNMRYRRLGAASNGVANLVRQDIPNDEQVIAFDLATLQQTPRIQAPYGTGLDIAPQPVQDMYPGHGPVLQVEQGNVGVHDLYSVDGPVDVQTFDKLVTAYGTIDVDVRAGQSAAGGLIVPLVSFEVPQITPTPFGDIALTPDSTTLLGPTLMGWQIGSANGEASFSLQVPAGGQNNLFAISFGYVAFPLAGQPFCNQSGCTTSFVY